MSVCVCGATLVTGLHLWGGGVSKRGHSLPITDLSTFLYSANDNLLSLHGTRSTVPPSWTKYVQH